MIDTALKVSWSFYCFIISISCGAENFPQAVWYGQLRCYFGKFGPPRGQPQSHKNPQVRLHLPLRNSFQVEALHALMQKQAIKKIQNETSLAFFN